MLKLVFKLALAGLLAHAVVKIVPEFWMYLKFKDAMGETARYAFRATEQQLHMKADKIAQQLEVPVEGEEISIAKEGQRVTIDTRWVAQLEYFPQRYYPWEFVIHIDETGSPLGEFMP